MDWLEHAGSGARVTSIAWSPCGQYPPRASRIERRARCARRCNASQPSLPSHAACRSLGSLSGRLDLGRRCSHALAAEHAAGSGHSARVMEPRRLPCAGRHRVRCPQQRNAHSCRRMTHPRWLQGQRAPRVGHGALGAARVGHRNWTLRQRRMASLRLGGSLGAAPVACTGCTCSARSHRWRGAGWLSAASATPALPAFVSRTPGGGA